MEPLKILSCRPYLTLQPSTAVWIRFEFFLSLPEVRRLPMLPMQSRQPSYFGSILFLLFLHYLLITRAQQNVSCFFPNGKTIADESSHNDFYTACPTSAGNDGSYMCCKTSYPFNDVCNKNGLCARQNDASLGEQQGLLRSTCTDPTWTSPSCLKLCITGLGKCSTRLLPRVASKCGERS